MACDIAVLTGPTASGKSALAFELLRSVPAELVNGDSVQVYRDFDVGSGKPSTEELGSAPHHLYSIISPKEHFDAARFVEAADRAIAGIRGRGRLPLIVGGTGLYLRSLLCGLVPVEPVAAEVKQEVEAIEQELRERIGSPQERCLQLLRRLAEVDPHTAERLHPSDSYRVRRALEVMLATGRSLSIMQGEHEHRDCRYRALVVALNPPRKRLYEAIDARVLAMLDAGLVEEVRGLLTRYDRSCQPFGAIGYRQVCEYLEGAYSYQEMVSLIQRDTRRFAKRQMTWWRNQPEKLGWRKTASAAELPSEKLSDLLREYCRPGADLGEAGVAFFRLC